MFLFQFMIEYFHRRICSYSHIYNVPIHFYVCFCIHMYIPIHYGTTGYYGSLSQFWGWLNITFLAMKRYHFPIWVMCLTEMFVQPKSSSSTPLDAGIPKDLPAIHLSDHPNHLPGNNSEKV